MSRVPADVFWQAFTGDQSSYAVGHGGTQRFAPGFSAIAGFADLADPDLEILRSISSVGDRIYTDGWAGSHDSHWEIVRETRMWKMVFERPLPVEEEGADIVRLNASHAQQAVELAVLTNPGPFGLRTIELGDYFGIFDRERLVAMAGERVQCGSLRELSGVCTHPDYVGRGYAARLSNKVIRLQMLRGQTSFLHVISTNEGAMRLYRKLGYVEELESVVRLIELVR